MTPRVLAYVANAGDGSVSVIDTTDNVVVRSPIPLGSPTPRSRIKPQNVALRPPTGDLLYVTNQAASGASIYVIDTNTNALTLTLPGVIDPLVPNNGGTFGLVVNHTYAYVTNIMANVLFRLELSTCPPFAEPCNTVATTQGLIKPYGVAIPSTGGLAYVTNSFVGGAVVFDSTLQPTRIGIEPGHGIAVSSTGPKTGFAYVAHPQSDSVSVIDPSSHAVSVIAVGGGPEGVAVTPDGAYVFVTNRSACTVSVIDTNTAAVVTHPLVVGTPSVGREPCLPFGIAFRPDGLRAYVTGTLTSHSASSSDDLAGVVWAIDAKKAPTPGASGVVVKTFGVGRSPQGITVGLVGGGCGTP